MSGLNPFDSVSQEVSLPGLTTGGVSQKPSPDEYQYRIGYYQIGGENGFDSQAELEALMTRSIRPDGGVLIVERKDSISPSTGTYTIVVTYLERRLNA